MAKNKKRERNTPFFLRVTLISVLAWLLLLMVTLVLTLRFALDTFQAKVDNGLIATTTSLSSLETVRDALRTGKCDDTLSDYLDNLALYTSDLDIISIADTQSIRVYHTLKDRIGLHFVGDDEDRALAGESYLSDAEGIMGYQHRSFSPVLDTDGTVLGFVMASTTQQRLDQLHNDIVSTYAKLGLTILLCTLSFSWLLAMYLQDYLRGAKPEDLLRTYLTQNDILNALEEGLVSLDASGKIRLLNDAAQRALGRTAESLLDTSVDQILRRDQGGSLHNVQGEDLTTNYPNLLVSSIRLPASNRWVSQVLILKDRSEAFRRAEQLSGTRHIISALRANTHEFLNKLQVIYGLLQMDRVREAQNYIADLNADHVQTVTPIMQLIHNTNVAALLLGKLNNMCELGIHMTLLGNSRLPEHSAYLRTQELVTVIGNLIENAIEAVNGASDDRSRNIVLQITEDTTGLLISVFDTGVGISEEILPKIWEQGFSTKADEGRGVGMSLIKTIVDNHNGSIEVDSDPGNGTSFTLIFNQMRKGAAYDECDHSGR